MEAKELREQFEKETGKEATYRDLFIGTSYTLSYSKWLENKVLSSELKEEKYVVENNTLSESEKIELVAMLTNKFNVDELNRLTKLLQKDGGKTVEIKISQPTKPVSAEEFFDKENPYKYETADSDLENRVFDKADMIKFAEAYANQVNPQLGEKGEEK